MMYDCWVRCAHPEIRYHTLCLGFLGLIFFFFCVSSAKTTAVWCHLIVCYAHYFGTTLEIWQTQSHQKYLHVGGAIVVASIVFASVHHHHHHHHHHLHHNHPTGIIIVTALICRGHDRVVSCCCECSASFVPAIRPSISDHYICHDLIWSPLKRLLYFLLPSFGAKVSKIHKDSPVNRRMPMISSKRALLRLWTRPLEVGSKNLGENFVAQCRSSLSPFGAQTYHVAAVLQRVSGWLNSDGPDRLEEILYVFNWVFHMSAHTRQGQKHIEGTLVFLWARDQQSAHRLHMFFKFVLSSCGQRSVNSLDDTSRAKWNRWWFRNNLRQMPWVTMTLLRRTCTVSACVFAWLQLSSEWIRWAIVLPWQDIEDEDRRRQISYPNLYNLCSLK